MREVYITLQWIAAALIYAVGDLSSLHSGSNSTDFSQCVGSFNQIVILVCGCGCGHRVESVAVERRRDARFATQGRYTTLPHPLHDKSGSPATTSAVFGPADFTYDSEARTCVCPAGKTLYRKGSRNVTDGFIGEHFRGTKRDCVPCARRAQCLRTPETTAVRNVAFFRGRVDAKRETHTGRMKARIDSAVGRAQYGRRFATVEPVFANLRHNKRLDRFTLRGRVKVEAQWKLYCLVHNIEKFANAGYAA